MTDLLSDSRPLVGESRPAEGSLGWRDHVNPASGKVQASIWIGGAHAIVRQPEPSPAQVGE